ncbi:MAG: hypothetical protein KC501_27955 [Myxococcales bacterium]|nr:hypothetical protein [Myxococcales bacterium]
MGEDRDRVTTAALMKLLELHVPASLIRKGRIAIRVRDRRASVIIWRARGGWQWAEWGGEGRRGGFVGFDEASAFVAFLWPCDEEAVDELIAEAGDDPMTPAEREHLERMRARFGLGGGGHDGDPG